MTRDRTLPVIRAGVGVLGLVNIVAGVVAVFTNAGWLSVTLLLAVGVLLLLVAIEGRALSFDISAGPKGVEMRMREARVRQDGVVEGRLQAIEDLSIEVTETLGAEETRQLLQHLWTRLREEEEAKKEALRRLDIIDGESDAVARKLRGIAIRLKTTSGNGPSVYSRATAARVVDVPEAWLFELDQANVVGPAVEDAQVGPLYTWEEVTRFRLAKLMLDAGLGLGQIRWLLDHGWAARSLAELRTASVSHLIVEGDRLREPKDDDEDAVTLRLPLGIAMNDVLNRLKRESPVEWSPNSGHDLERRGQRTGGVPS